MTLTGNPAVDEYPHTITQGILDGAKTTAYFSTCGQFRYRLDRYWDSSASRILFVMLNPSLANENKNDPTVARCHARALSLNGGRHGSYRVCNIFALISPYPKFLESSGNRGDGPINDSAISEACRWADSVVCAWGGSKNYILERSRAVETIIRREFSGPLLCFAINASGTPKHPLYVSHRTELSVWIHNA